MSKDDLSLLERSLVSIAHNTIKEHNRFIPFGGVIDTSGKFAMATAEGNTVDDILTTMMSGFEAHAKESEIKAAGLCYVWMDKKVNKKKSTMHIACILETIDGYIRRITIPYKKRFLKKVWFGEKKVEDVTGHQIFCDDSKILRLIDSVNELERLILEVKYNPEKEANFLRKLQDYYIYALGKIEGNLEHNMSLEKKRMWILRDSPGVRTLLFRYSRRSKGFNNLDMKARNISR